MALDVRHYLKSVGTEVKTAFVQDRTILSFDQYLELFDRDPSHQARNAAQYLKDVFDHYGVVDVQTPVGKVRRFKRFDCEFAGGAGRIAGQEEIQAGIYRVLQNFVRHGAVDKLILLHGPNGSAKSSLVAAMQAATEDYSRKPEGALYR